MKTKQSFRIATIAILAIFAVSTCVMAQTAKRTTTAKRSQVQAKPWAKLENGTLTFSYGAKPAGKDVYDVPLNACYFDNSDIPWYEKRKEIKKVVFSRSFKRVTNIKSTHCWFEGCSNLSSIIGFENFNTANVTFMNGMFAYCSELSSLNLSHFNTNKVESMSIMFHSCKNLYTLDLSNLNTSKTTNMKGMFAGCKSLKTIIVSDTGWKASLDQFMFDGCPAEVRTQSGKILRPAPTADQGINPNAVSIPPYQIQEKEAEAFGYIRYDLYFVGYFFTFVKYSPSRRGYEAYFDNGYSEYYDTLDHAAEAMFVWKQYGLVRTVGKY